MKKYRIVIKADYDDGDMVEDHLDIKEDELEGYIALLTRVGGALEVEGGDWYTGDQSGPENEPEKMYEGILSNSDIERFGDMVPSSPHGIHSIESIEIFKIGEIVKIY